MQKKILFLFFLSLWLQAKSNGIFDQYFTERVLRIDCIHGGTAEEEFYAIDELWQEPFWPANRTHLIDTLNLGNTLFQVFDKQTHVLIFSRGSCTIFEEWRTTDEAHQGIRRAFSESFRMPWPKSPVQISISSRNRKGQFQEIWTYEIDPSDPNIRKEIPYKNSKTVAYLNNGSPENKVDIVVLPEGYTQKEMKAFRKQAIKLFYHFFQIEPFASHQKDFNVWMIEFPSHESGIDNPNKGIFKNSAFSSSFNALGIDRYVLTFDNKTVRKVASRVPYDYIIILVNEKKYGGGGIFNLYAILMANHERTETVFLHEFGHLFAGLGDEYYTSSVTYNEFYPLDVEPWEPNLTICTNRRELKWKTWIDPETPIPTPWGKETFDLHQQEYQKKLAELENAHATKSQIDSLNTSHSQWIKEFFASQKFKDCVGLFEGAGYTSKGLYRPSLLCCMFSGNAKYDPICRNAIERMILFHTKY